MDSFQEQLKARVDKICILVNSGGAVQFYEAASLALTVLHDSVGGAHPLVEALRNALEKSEAARARAVSLAVVTLFNEGGIKSPRLSIAHELESNILDLAQSQVEAAERAQPAGSNKSVHLALAAFLAGAAVEDALRRLCDARGIAYDPQHSTISKLQSALYQPSKSIEVINASENKQLTAWGDTRNKADHGKFSELTQAEVMSMVIGVRGFIDKHLP